MIELKSTLTTIKEQRKLIEEVNRLQSESLRSEKKLEKILQRV